MVSSQLAHSVAKPFWMADCSMRRPGRSVLGVLLSGDGSQGPSGRGRFGMSPVIASARISAQSVKLTPSSLTRSHQNRSQSSSVARSVSTPSQKSPR